MKVLQIAALALVEATPQRQVTLVQGDIRVIEKPHNICPMDQVPDEYTCGEVNGKKVCEKSCDGGYERMYCECYRRVGFILLYDVSRCAWNNYHHKCFDDNNNQVELPKRKKTMMNDYEPTQITPVEVHENEVDNAVYIECENDTKLMWDCDNRHPGHKSTCSKQCPNGSGGVAERTCNCDGGSCSWEYKVPSIDCLNAITDHHRTANKKHKIAKRQERLEKRKLKQEPKHEPKQESKKEPREKLIEQVMSKLALDAVPIKRIEVEEQKEEDSEETTEVMTASQMSDRVLMIKDQVDEIAIRTFLEDLESFDKMTLITITNGLLTRD